MAHDVKNEQEEMSMSMSNVLPIDDDDSNISNSSNSEDSDSGECGSSMNGSISDRSDLSEESESLSSFLHSINTNDGRDRSETPSSPPNRNLVLDDQDFKCAEENANVSTIADAETGGSDRIPAGASNLMSLFASTSISPSEAIGTSSAAPAPAPAPTISKSSILHGQFVNSQGDDLKADTPTNISNNRTKAFNEVSSSPQRTPTSIHDISKAPSDEAVIGVSSSPAFTHSSNDTSMMPIYSVGHEDEQGDRDRNTPRRMNIYDDHSDFEFPPRMGKPSFERQITERRRNGPKFGDRGWYHHDVESDCGVQNELSNLLSLNQEKLQNGGRNGHGHKGSSGGMHGRNTKTFPNYGIGGVNKEFFLPLNDLKHNEQHPLLKPMSKPMKMAMNNPTSAADDAPEKKWRPSPPSVPISCNITMESIQSTILGSIVFVLFHIVFCLAQASAIHRPYSNQPVFGHMVRMAAVSPIIGGTIFIFLLNDVYPAVYPSIDVFAAPFFSQMAAVVDETLVHAGKINKEDDIVFLTTFGVLSALGLGLTGLLILIGTKVKLANLSAFLPYPVMCGFFSGVGILCWTLAFQIDTGEDVWSVLFHGTGSDMVRCLQHHFGSIIFGSTMYIVGRSNQGLVPLVTLMSIPIVYLVMYMKGTTLEEARSQGWFWKIEELEVAKVSWENIEDLRWQAPLPFGIMKGVVEGKVHYPAVIKGLPIVVSMAVIYFIRCSMHAPALRKSQKNLSLWLEEQTRLKESKNSSSLGIIAGDGESGNRMRSLSQESIEFHQEDDVENEAGTAPSPTRTLSMADLLYDYGKVLIVTGIGGGLAVVPSIGARGTMFKLGAGSAAPQYGSIFLLAVFYLTQFDLVGYLPKMTFASLLFVSSIEMIQTWFVNSYHKTAIKSEWIVVPSIVVLTFVIGVLQSVFVGLAISTFIFVATFFRSGLVKFIASGLTVHSATERNIEDCDWLDQNGDLIQLLVLQSHIFFGNANSCLSYVSSMFEEPPETISRNLPFPLPPLPKYLIIDVTLVTGIDTSAVDVIAEIVQLCHSKKCYIMIAGLTSDLKKVLALGNVMPSLDKKSPFSILRYPPDLESALCKAEDGLLRSVYNVEKKELKRSHMRKASIVGDGFLYALRQIDLQHDLDVERKLARLEKYTSIIDLKAGESLFRDNDGICIEERETGIFFIEHGMMNIERDSSLTNTRGSRGPLSSQRQTKNRLSPIFATPRMITNSDSLTNLQARTATIGREAALLKNVAGTMRERRTVRLARLKPGFVIGTLGVTSQPFNPGDHIAVTPCRLHHLKRDDIEHLEKENPRVVLDLFKMMSTLLTRKQEMTIHQLTTISNIMTSLAPSKPVGRLTMAAIKNVVG